MQNDIEEAIVSHHNENDKNVVNNAIPQADERYVFANGGRNKRSLFSSNDKSSTSATKETSEKDSSLSRFRRYHLSVYYKLFPQIIREDEEMKDTNVKTSTTSPQKQSENEVQTSTALPQQEETTTVAPTTDTEDDFSLMYLKTKRPLTAYERIKLAEFRQYNPLTYRALFTEKNSPFNFSPEKETDTATDTPNPTPESNNVASTTPSPETPPTTTNEPSEEREETFYSKYVKRYPSIFDRILHGYKDISSASKSKSTEEEKQHSNDDWWLRFRYRAAVGDGESSKSQLTETTTVATTTLEPLPTPADLAALKLLTSTEERQLLFLNRLRMLYHRGDEEPRELVSMYRSKMMSVQNRLLGSDNPESIDPEEYRRRLYKEFLRVDPSTYYNWFPTTTEPPITERRTLTPPASVSEVDDQKLWPSMADLFF